MRRHLLPALGLAVIACAPPAAAQDPRPAPWPGVAWTGPDLDRIERALYDRDELDLTDDQVRRLEELRRSMVERRLRVAGERLDLSSRARAGLIEDDELSDAIADLRELEADAADEANEAVDDILTADQQERLDDRRMVMRRVPDGLLRRGYGWPAPPAPMAPPVPLTPYAPPAPVAPHAPPPPPEMHWYWDGGRWRRYEGWQPYPYAQYWRTPAPAPDSRVLPRRRR